MGVFTLVVLIANVLYWVFLEVYFAVRLLNHFDNTRYLADCQRADGGRLRVIVEREDENEDEDDAEDRGSGQVPEIGDVVYRETPWFPLLMALVALFLLLVLCLSWEAWSARESLAAVLRI